MSHVTQPDDPVNYHRLIAVEGEITNIPGLTKREYFAAMAMQGLLANVDDGQMAFGSVALEAISYADALIIQLNR
jgi:hypothetical protein